MGMFKSKKKRKKHKEEAAAAIAAGTLDPEEYAAGIEAKKHKKKKGRSFGGTIKKQVRAYGRTAQEAAEGMGGALKIAGGIAAGDPRALGGLATEDEEVTAGAAPVAGEDTPFTGGGMEAVEKMGKKTGEMEALEKLGKKASGWTAKLGRPDEDETGATAEEAAEGEEWNQEVAAEVLSKMKGEGLGMTPEEVASIKESRTADIEERYDIMSERLAEEANRRGMFSSTSAMNLERELRTTQMRDIQREHATVDWQQAQFRQQGMSQALSLAAGMREQDINRAFQQGVIDQQERLTLLLAKMQYDDKKIDRAFQQGLIDDQTRLQLHAIREQTHLQKELGRGAFWSEIIGSTLEGIGYIAGG